MEGDGNNRLESVGYGQTINDNNNSGGRMARRNIAGNRGEEKRLCNCRNRGICPLDNKCLLDNIVYEATVRTEGSNFRYVGSTANSFKKRLANHLHSFRNPGMKNSTSLARTIHDLTLTLNPNLTLNPQP